MPDQNEIAIIGTIIKILESDRFDNAKANCEIAYKIADLLKRKDE